jgi:hypothetical protein
LYRTFLGVFFHVNRVGETSTKHTTSRKGVIQNYKNSWSISESICLSDTKRCRLLSAKYAWTRFTFTGTTTGYAASMGQESKVTICARKCITSKDCVGTHRGRSCTNVTINAQLDFIPLRFDLDGARGSRLLEVLKVSLANNTSSQGSHRADLRRHIVQTN